MPSIITEGAMSAQGYGFGRKAGGAVGTVGIFALGITGTASTTRNKYTFATCTSTSAASASAASYNGSAAGNSTRGIFALGYVCGVGPSTTRNKYTYACCSSTASGVGAASCGSCRGSAASNGTCGVNV